MFPVASQAETLSQYNSTPFERRASSYSDQAQPTLQNRPPRVELPRPVEPRPSLHASLSDTSAVPTRPSPFSTPTGTQADFRPQWKNLPALRDILPPGPAVSSPSSYPSQWTSSQGPPPSQQTSNDNYYGHASPRPPIHTSIDRDHPYQPQHTRSFEVPILETSPVARHHPQNVPPSPFTRFPEPARDYMSARPERYPGSASYGPSGVTSPYTPTPGEEGAQYRPPPPSTYDSQQHTPVQSNFPPPPPPSSGPESQKRYLGVQELPEGTYHCYEGGHRIPTHVDGEQVNPAWGLTKANKPRKRLALACLDCREKKIKCEPGAVSCLQCEKAKRPCRRTITHHASSDTSPTATWPGDSPNRRGPSISDPTPTGSHGVESDPLSKRRPRDDPSPPNIPNKRHRSGSPLSTSVTEPSVLARGAMIPDQGGSISAAPSTVPQGVLHISSDPYATHPHLTLTLLKLHFLHVNSSSHALFPHSHFMHWVRSTSEKSFDELMVLYAMLASGSIFADDSTREFGSCCAQVVEDAMRSCVEITVSVAQSKMLIELYHFSRGANALAVHHAGAAIRSLEFLGLNTEAGCADDVDPSRKHFGLSPTQLIECKRRTFWSAFLMERQSLVSVCLLKPQDVFVRLPCTEDMYERGEASDAPFLTNELVDAVQTLITPTSAVSAIAWLVFVAAICGDVRDFISRAPHLPPCSYRDAYETFYHNTLNRMQGWASRLPEHLQFTPANLERSFQLGYAGAFVSMHALHHFALMKLNRCLRQSQAPDLVARNIRTAHSHGHAMLHLAGAVLQARHSFPSAPPFSSPFPGYIALSAIDIVSAGGPDSTLLSTIDEIDAAVPFIRELSQFWPAAHDQSKRCELRFYQIKNILSRPEHTRSGCWLGRKWGLEKPLEVDRLRSSEDDCIYGLGDADQVYFDAFKEERQGHAAKGSAGPLRIA